jgi:putative addiction module component (TIGR02574 family)
MVARNLLNDVLALPVEERLEFFEGLRQNLLNEPGLHVLTEDERQVLDARLADYESNPADGSPWEEVEARLMGLLKDRP